jgi:hypothetical protein
MRRRRQTEAGRYHDARQIRTGHNEYLGVAQTPEHARAIEAHVRQRLTAFRLEQKRRYESQPR